MSDAPYDLILVGGGLANSLIAWRLATMRPELRLLLVEAGSTLGGNHTWSLHQHDLESAQWLWIDPLVEQRWDRYQVQFPAFNRTLHSGYASLTSERLHRVIAPTLHGCLRLNSGVRHISPRQVVLHSGETLRAHAVIDGRGAAPDPNMVLGHQVFLGQLVRTRQPNGLDMPILMDATVEQGDGYRFVYVLPFAADRLLIEDTHYVERHGLETKRLRENIQGYAQARGWLIDDVLREEQGALPITLAGDFERFWASAQGQPRSGLRAGLFHCTTGYSLPHAVRLADTLAGLSTFESVHQVIHSMARHDWRRQRFYRLLNRMLFLAGDADNRWRVMQRFYHLPAELIERFYAGRTTPVDKLRILSGKPPVPVGQAIRAALRTHPRHFETPT